eukprot:COSAG01_NODE_1212_length_11214_cov_31.716689_4_plen_397_part_00
MLRPWHVGVFVAMDVQQFITFLRTLIHGKRGKEQGNTGLQEAAFRMLGASTGLNASLPQLMRSKTGFVPKLMHAIKHELVNPCEADGWDAAAALGRGRFFVMNLPEQCAVLVPRAGVDYMGVPLTAQGVRVCFEGSVAGACVTRHAAVAPLFAAPAVDIARAAERGHGVEPLTAVPSSLAVVEVEGARAVLTTADVQTMRCFTGRFERLRQNGVLLVKVCWATIAQHTRYRLKNNPKIDTKTVAQVATDGGHDGTIESDVSTDEGRAAAAAATASLQAALEVLPAATDRAQLMEQRTTKLEALRATLERGEQGGSADFADARTTLLVVVAAVVMRTAAAAAERVAAAAAEAAAAEAEADSEEEEPQEEEGAAAMLLDDDADFDEEGGADRERGEDA